MPALEVEFEKLLSSAKEETIDPEWTVRNSGEKKRLDALGDFSFEFRQWVEYIAATHGLLKLGYPFKGDELSPLTWRGLVAYESVLNEIKSKG